MINYKVWDFPALPVQKQLFHVPGAAFDGGFTSGGARVLSPEPGGRAVLEIQLAFQVKEWTLPLSSWLMSKINGEIFRVRLAKTPQLIDFAALGSSAGVAVPWQPFGLATRPVWDNNRFWSSDLTLMLASGALEGTTTLAIDMASYGEILKIGHVIGHGDNAYLIDEIEYSGSVATVNVTPPLRRNVASYDMILTRPYFTGTIANGNEMRTLYEAANVGHIQMNRIILQEAVI